MNNNGQDIKDINDLDSEFEKLNKRIALLNSRFLAVGMDYQHYIDNSWAQSDIFELRNNLQYRVFCTEHHLKLVIREQLYLNDHINYLKENQPGLISPNNPIFEQYSEQISSIFDSVIYHSCSVYDYIGSLINFICGDKRPLKWSNLIKSMRDTNNKLSKSPIALKLINFDNKLVGKLYRHRSDLIHEKRDLGPVRVTVEIKSGIIKSYFFTSQKFNKNFLELKELSIQNNLTVRYVAFWLVNRTIDTVTEILFALRDEMKLNKKVPHGIFLLKGDNGENLPISTQFWREGAH